MLYFRLSKALDVVGVSTQPDTNAKGFQWAYVPGAASPAWSEGWCNRNDFGTFDQAERIAKSTTKLMGKLYLAVDAGPFTLPRYDVIEAPAVGDEVSRSFNGDSYPAGKIVKISDSFRRIHTDNGTVFWRRGGSACWKADGTWSMIHGRVDERNPSF